jgi:hypothetical protein
MKTFAILIVFLLAGLAGAYKLGAWLGSYTPADICVSTSDDGFDVLKRNTEVCLK